MKHLIFDRGEWRIAVTPWSESTALGAIVEPKAGDTLSEFTSHRDAVKDLARRGLTVKVLRTAMWGERDFRIE